jgi:ribosomal protein L11 methylase PrmA
LIDSLQSCCGKLVWKLPETTWGQYYDDTNYTEAATEHKLECVRSMIAATSPAMVWDLGANDGRYSRLASGAGHYAISFDLDPVAVEKNWQQVVRQEDDRLLPLQGDLTNPSSGIGWAGAERQSLEARGPADLVVALALVHHLAIGHNVPLPRIAEFFARLGRSLIVEFVPRGDSQVQRLLASREDVFTGYHEEGFQNAFAGHFNIIRHDKLRDSERSLYLMRRSEGT